MSVVSVAPIRRKGKKFGPNRKEPDRLYTLDRLRAELPRYGLAACDWPVDDRSKRFIQHGVMENNALQNVYAYLSTHPVEILIDKIEEVCSTTSALFAAAVLGIEDYDKVLSTSMPTTTALSQRTGIALIKRESGWRQPTAETYAESEQTTDRREALEGVRNKFRVDTAHAMNNACAKIADTLQAYNFDFDIPSLIPFIRNPTVETYNNIPADVKELFDIIFFGTFEYTRAIVVCRLPFICFFFSIFGRLYQYRTNPRRLSLENRESGKGKTNRNDWFGRYTQIANFFRLPIEIVVAIHTASMDIASKFLMEASFVRRVQDTVSLMPLLYTRDFTQELVVNFHRNYSETFEKEDEKNLMKADPTLNRL